LYFSPYAVRVIKSLRMKWVGHVACMEEMKKRIQKDNIKMDLKKLRWQGVDWVQLAQDGVQWWAVVNIVMDIKVP
jgi:hypothetical protein